MKSLTIPILKNGGQLKAKIDFEKNESVNYQNVEEFVKWMFGDDAEIDNPDKFRRRLEKLNTK